PDPRLVCVTTARDGARVAVVGRFPPQPSDRRAATAAAVTAHGKSPLPSGSSLSGGAREARRPTPDGTELRSSNRKQAADERLRPMRRAWGREWGSLVAQVAARRRK